MHLKPRKMFTKVRFSEWRLRSDIDAIRRFYRGQGFIENKISVYSLNRDTLTGNVNLQLVVNEGPRATVSQVKIQPLLSVIDSSVLTKLSTKYACYLKNSTIASDVQMLKKILSSKGYLNAIVNYSIDLDTAHYQAKVIFNVNSGPLIKVGEIQLGGIKKLKSVYILRELKFKNGDILTSNRIMESEQNLYRTNLLNSVQIEHVSQPIGQSNSLLTEVNCPVNVQVQETDFFNIQTGIGYSFLGSSKYYEGIRGHVESSYSNLFGLGHHIVGRTDISFLEQKGDLTYSVPWAFGIPIQCASKLYINRQLRENDSVLFPGIELSLTYQPNIHLQYNLRLTLEELLWYHSTKNSNSKPKELTKIIGTDISYDTRDDIIEPSSGIWNYFSFDVAGLLDTNSNQYLKFVENISFYWKYKKVTWASRFNIGWIYKRDTLDEIPPQKLFSIEETKALRGFSHKELNAKKGLFLLSANLIEIRFPLFWWFKGALFIDAGNVYVNPLRMNIFKDLRWSVGPGLRVKTPLFIIRTDVGFKLFKHEGESPYAFQLNIGNTF
jgi:outer membrane protein assembly complex protein YaeT